MSAGDRFREQAQVVQDQLDAMEAAHLDDHDPCDCLPADDLKRCRDFVARRLELAEQADELAARPKPKRGLELLAERYGPKK